MHVLRAEAVLRILDDAQTAKCSCMRIYNKSLLEICAGSVHIRSTCMSSPWTSSLCVSWHMVEWLRKMAELTHPINVMQKPRWLPVALHARHKSGVVPARLGEGQTDLVLLRVQIQRAAGLCRPRSKMQVLCRQWKSSSNFVVACGPEFSAKVSTYVRCRASD